MLRAARALVRKDLTISLRNPPFFVLSLAIPLFFVTVYALVTFVSATNPVAVARESHGPYSEAFVKTLERMHSVDGPWYDVKTLDPQKARAAYRAGAVPGLITIPSDFDRNLAKGEGATVALRVFNINSDGTKNLQLRLAHAIYLFDQSHARDKSVGVNESTIFPHETPFRRYWASALLVFAVIYVSVINSGSLVAREWEERTAKGIVLSPGGFLPFVAGKWATALLQTLAGTALVLVPLAAIMGLPVFKLGTLSWLYLLSIGLYGAAIGAVLGVAFRSSLQIVPVATVIAVVHLLLCGLEDYLRGLAHGGLLYRFWLASSWWPVSGIITDIRFSIEGFSRTGPDWVSLGWLLALTVLLTTAAVWFLRKRLTFAQGA